MRTSCWRTGGKCNRLAGRREAVRLASEAAVRKMKNIKMRPETHSTMAGEEMRQRVAGDEMRQPREIDPREINTREIAPGEISAGATVLPPPVWGKKCVTATMLAVFLAELAPAAAMGHRRPVSALRVPGPSADGCANTVGRIGTRTGE